MYIFLQVDFLMLLDYMCFCILVFPATEHGRLEMPLTLDLPDAQSHSRTLKELHWGCIVANSKAYLEGAPPTDEPIPGLFFNPSYRSLVGRVLVVGPMCGEESAYGPNLS